MAELTKEQVGRLRGKANDMTDESAAIGWCELCDSHEALRLRAEEAERNRDEARRFACELSSIIPKANGERETARDAALRLWPSSADRLFPPDGKVTT